MTVLADLVTPVMPNFCPGCGDFGIWSGFKQAAVKADWNNTNSAMVVGVGCHGHMVNFVKITAFGSLHGRSLPAAAGIKMANNRLNVFVFTGDGDSLAEGGNHFMHACRRNHDINIFFHDNAIYGLTTGQTSPRSPHGFVTKSTPEGNKDEPINPLALAITTGATFVARAYAGDIPRLADIMVKANQHKGLSFVDILQPCVTFNKEHTHQFYQENTYWLGDEYNPSDKFKAFEKAHEWGIGKIPLGVFYLEERASYEQQLPLIEKVSLVDQEVKVRDVGGWFEKFM